MPGTAVVRLARDLDTDMLWSRLTGCELIAAHSSAVRALTAAAVKR
jgi:hypothetical protein